jgi:hypothetical protein
MDTQADKMLDTFVAQNGTVEDWGGDRSEWLTAFGFWCGGWYACQKSAQQAGAANVASSRELSPADIAVGVSLATGLIGSQRG